MEELKQKLNKRLNEEIEKMLNKDFLSLEEIGFLAHKLDDLEHKEFLKEFSLNNAFSCRPEEPKNMFNKEN